MHVLNYVVSFWRRGEGQTLISFEARRALPSSIDVLCFFRRPGRAGAIFAGRVRIQDSRFGVQGIGFKVRGVSSGIQGSRYRVQAAGLRILVGSGSVVHDLGLLCCFLLVFLVSKSLQKIPKFLGYLLGGSHEMDYSGLYWGPRSPGKLPNGWFVVSNVDP